MSNSSSKSIKLSALHSSYLSSDALINRIAIFSLRVYALYGQRRSVLVFFMSLTVLGTVTSVGVSTFPLTRDSFIPDSSLSFRSWQFFNASTEGRFNCCVDLEIPHTLIIHSSPYHSYPTSRSFVPIMSSLTTVPCDWLLVFYIFTKCSFLYDIRNCIAVEVCTGRPVEYPQ